MSRIGKLPVKIAQGVTVEVTGHTVKVNGPKGTLEKTFPHSVKLEVVGDEVIVKSQGGSKQSASNWGTARSLIDNMVVGVSGGWSKKLELVGTGYRAEVLGNILTLTVGYSHPIKIEAPEGVSFKVDKTFITVEGIDREIVGQVSSNIREVRPPEPYKGKGIKYSDEVIRRKAGKAAKTAGAA